MDLGVKASAAEFNHQTVHQTLKASEAGLHHPTRGQNSSSRALTTYLNLYEILSTMVHRGFLALGARCTSSWVMIV